MRSASEEAHSGGTAEGEDILADLGVGDGGWFHLVHVELQVVEGVGSSRLFRQVIDRVALANRGSRLGAGLAGCMSS